MINLISLLSLAVAGSARPFLEKRDISSTQLLNFNLMQQWAAASYCPNNNRTPNKKITCGADACREVAAADTKSVIEFTNGFGTDTTGFVATDNTNKHIVVSFRGTAGIVNQMVDIQIPLVNVDLCTACQAEQGFWSAYGSVRSDVVKAVKGAAQANPSYEIISTGHSLGAAIATLAAADLRNNGLRVDLINFGSPRVGNAAFARFVTNQNKGNNYRFTHTKDLIPRVPPTLMGYQHISPEYWITSGNNAPVTSNDIKVCDGIENAGCNLQYFDPTMDDHVWYFTFVAACLNNSTGS